MKSMLQHNASRRTARAELPSGLANPLPNQGYEHGMQMARDSGPQAY